MVVVVEGEGKRDGVVVVGAGEDSGGGAGGVWGRRDEEGRSRSGSRSPDDRGNRSKDERGSR